MKYEIVKQLNNKTSVVLVQGNFKMLQVFRFPVRQEDVFGDLMGGKSMSEIDGMYRQQASEKLGSFQTRRLLKEEDHIAVPEEMEMRRIPGGTGWQVEVLWPVMLSLEQYWKVREPDQAELDGLQNQLMAALSAARQARFFQPHIHARNVFVTGPAHFVLDGFDGDGILEGSDEDLEACMQKAADALRLKKD